MKFAKRADKIDSSFVREILKLASNSDIISFAGGLPNPNLFPSQAFRKASEDILSNPKMAQIALQYGESAGFYALREEIAKTYKQKDNLDIDPDLIIITTGSQQALDLIAKIFINKNDTVLLESPTYLAAIQAFQFYEPKFDTISLTETGPNINELEPKSGKLFYTIPNFQNPSGVTWNTNTRKFVADWAYKENVIIIEDDPYGEIRFSGKRQPTLKSFNDDVILLGSFSKILAPGLRLGWIIAPNKDWFDKLILAKQASDLHSSQFTQLITWKFYKDFDSQKHIKELSNFYSKQKELLIKEIEAHIPEISLNNPEGGMFLWGELPIGYDSVELLKIAIEQRVAFVPGIPFYINDIKDNTMRLNFSNSSLQDIKDGVRRLKRSVDIYKGQNSL